MKGYVGEVAITAGSEEIVRHRRSYQSADFIFDPLHYLPLLEEKIGALDQAAPLQGWELPPEFSTLRRLLEARLRHELARGVATATRYEVREAWRNRYGSLIGR